ncbi:uncharacterized protein ACMZJ9_004525 [Mantella aurantiaca]
MAAPVALGDQSCRLVVVFLPSLYERLLTDQKLKCSRQYTSDRLLPSCYHISYRDMRLFIFINLCFLGITGSSRCVHQVRVFRVQSGGSVTIPCSYSAPEKQNEDVQIIWNETNENSCTNKKRIVSPSGNVTETYIKRLYREKDPNQKHTEYIRITELKPTDGPRFCCQLYNIKYTLTKGNTFGTLLQFTDKKYVSQLDELMAVSGEEVIIPCYYSKDISDIIHISWYYADSADGVCTTQRIHIWNKAEQHDRYSLVNFKQDASLRIHNIYENDQHLYCCVVSSPEESIFPKQRTMLIVAEYQSSWVQPTEETTAEEGHSVNLSCSYTFPNGRYTERDIVRVNVYWRVGNVTGPYAYHPYQEMVHSTYINRTYITGITNLMIKGVTTADNTTFHCFVVVKLCAGDNDYEDTIEYGGGTRLIVIDGKNSNSAFDFLIIIIAVSSVTVLIILIGILIILKVKGVICKKKTKFVEQNMDSIQATGDVTFEEAPYCEISIKKPADVPDVGADEPDKKETEGGGMGDGEDGNLLYAKLNKTKLKEKHPTEPTKQNEEVVYAAVVKTTSD